MLSTWGQGRHSGPASFMLLSLFLVWERRKRQEWCPASGLEDSVKREAVCWDEEPGRNLIWKEESQFSLEHVELEIADHVETSRRHLPRQVWGPGAQITESLSFLISRLPPFTMTTQTYSEKLAALEIQEANNSSATAQHCPWRHPHIYKPSSRAVLLHRKNPVQKMTNCDLLFENKSSLIPILGKEQRWCFREISSWRSYGT